MLAWFRAKPPVGAVTTTTVGAALSASAAYTPTVAEISGTQLGPLQPPSPPLFAPSIKQRRKKRRTKRPRKRFGQDKKRR